MADDTILIVALAGAAWYLTQHPELLQAAPAPTLLPGTTRPPGGLYGDDFDGDGVPDDPDGPGFFNSTGGRATILGIGTAASVVPLFVGGAGAAAAAGGAGAAGTAAGVAGGIGAAGTIAITAGIAAAAILAWGIIHEGWFRGGEEALVVNPARDLFLKEFAPYDPYQDVANPAGFYGLAALISDTGGNAVLFQQLLNADTKAELTTAVQAIQSYIANNRPRVEEWIAYALRAFPLEPDTIGMASNYGRG